MNKATEQKERLRIKVKRISAIVEAFFVALLVFSAGCEPAPPTAPKPPVANGKAPDKLQVYTRYAPMKVEIMPLTEFVAFDDDEGPSKIKIYVSLLDSFDCQIKGPGKFRFELYRHVHRSAEPKGRRIAIWPDIGYIDLTDVVENNNYWRDFFRAYEFALDFQPEKDQSYILEVTCLCPDDRRLSADFILKYTK